MPLHTGRLTVTRDDSVVQMVNVFLPVLTIGRLPDNHLVLDHPQVSRHHAELLMVPEGVALVDRVSANGTYFGAERTTAPRLPANQPRLLADGATFHIGPFALYFEHCRLPTAARFVPDGPERPSRYLEHLPIIFQDNDFLGRMLLIFEAIWEPLEQRQDYIEMYFNPGTCPEPFLAWLAEWLGVALNPRWTEARRRQELRAGFDLLRWQGSCNPKYGLAGILERWTGLSADEIKIENAEPFVVRISITPPPGVTIDRQQIEELVRTHKPAPIGYVLDLQP